MNVSQLIAPTVVTPINARKVKVSNIKVKTPKKAKQPPEHEVLCAELKALTGAPCSPLMTVEQLKAKIEEVKSIPVIEEDVEEEAEIIEAKPRTIPAKPQGIGAYCVNLLKGGMKPKEVLINALFIFPEAKTSMACVYWYASKIKQGLL